MSGRLKGILIAVPVVAALAFGGAAIAGPTGGDDGIAPDAGVSWLSQLRIRIAAGFDADTYIAGQQDTRLKNRGVPVSSPGLAIWEPPAAGGFTSWSRCPRSRRQRRDVDSALALLGPP